MKTGDVVTITGNRGTVIGTIEQLCPLDKLPDLPPPAPPVGQACEVMAEIGVDLVAMITYRYTDETTLMFAAMHVTRPEADRPPGWYDLQGQLLTIEPLSAS